MENVPAGVPAQVSEYIFRHLTRLENMFSTKDELTRLTALPAKPVVGKLYYFKNTILPNITAEGVWTYKSTGWSYLG